MNHQKLAKDVIQEMGGKDNILQSWHCITRLRFNVKDEKKVDVDKIKKMDGVIEAQFSGDQFQVVIGNEVAKVFEEVQKEVGEQKEDAPKNNKKQRPMEVIMDVIAGIFTPILPAIIGAGLIKGIMSALTVAGLLDPTSTEYFVFNMISDAPFHFLPFLVAASSAKKFNVNQFIAMTMAGILMYPSFMNLAAEGQTVLSFFGLPIQILTYSSSVLPIILSVWLLSFVYKRVDKIVPSVVRIIFTPLIVLLIVSPIMLLAIAPLGNFVGIYVESFFARLFEVAGPFAGFLMGGTMSIIVITGMQHTFIPSTLTGFGTVGYDTVLLPMSLVSNLGQCGAAFGVSIKSKDPKMKSVALSTAISALFGITEPAIYGVTLKLKKPFYAALVGGAIGGGIFGTFVVKAFAFGIPGITAIPSYIESGTSNFMMAMIGMVSSLIVSFVLTLVLKWDTGEDVVEEVPTINNDVKKDLQETEINSPMKGEIVPLSEVGDKIFADEIVGKGVAIIPSEGVVKAPFDGTLAMVASTKHAIGLIAKDGLELLIHVGIDTVSLQGKYFEVLLKEGDSFKKGDKILEFDIDAIKESGVSTISPIVVTNLSEDNYVKASRSSKVNYGELLFNLLTLK